ncbi:P-loop NTPase [Brevibacillus fluminis]|uniref:P-loop NTPase n=1 Tax=Brevibacillus fluminis TaxID=511487 RepID=UPI003F8A5CE8
MIKKRLVLIDEDVLALTELKQRMAASQFLSVIGEAHQIEDVWKVLQTEQPDLVLVGSLRQAEIGVLCQQIRFMCPQVTVIATCSAKELHWEPFLRNLQIWVLAKPVQPEQVELLSMQPSPASYMQSGMGTGAPLVPVQSSPSAYAVAESPVATPAYPAKREKPKHLITVYGPKGGVGKTFLSRELAVYFRQVQQNGRPLKVLAIDFNLDLGTFATSLNLPRTPNLFTWAQAIDQQIIAMMQREGVDSETAGPQEWQEYATSLRLGADEVEPFIVVHEQSGLHILTSPREIRQSFEIKDYHLYVMLETLKQSDYDVILIDTAPDTSDATIQALFFSQRVVLVGTPVVDAIENIQRLLKLLREAEYPEERIQVCINRLQRKEMFTLEEIRAYFQLHPGKTIFSIPDDDEVKRSINAGMPIMLGQQRSAARDAIEKLAKSIVAIEDETASQKTPKPKEKARSSMWSWLRR